MSEVNVMNFLDWKAENASGDELEDLKSYTGYVRTEKVKADEWTFDFERDLRTSFLQKAVADGHVAADDSEAQQALFTQPEYSAPRSLALMEKMGSGRLTAIAANNQEALPEGVAPEQVWDDIVTYKAKQKSYDKFVESDPDMAAQATDLIEDLEFWKKRAEGYANSQIFSRATESALQSGEIPAARIYKEDGTSEVRLGRGAQGKTMQQILDESKDFGVTPEDIVSIGYQLQQPVGRLDNKASFDLKEDIRESLVFAVKEDEIAKAQYGTLKELYTEYDKAINEDDSKEQSRLKRLINDEVTSLYVSAGRKDPVLGEADIELEEFGNIVEQQVASDLLNEGAFEQQNDPDKIGNNLKRYGYGYFQFIPAVAASSSRFQSMLDANPDLTEEEVNLLNTQRDIIAPSFFSTADELLREDWTGGVTREKWLAALQEGRANGVKDVDILDEFLSDEDNYSEFRERTTGIGKSIAAATTSLLAFVPALAGNELARDYLIGVQAENATNRMRANLFGSNFGGMFQDVSEAIAPVLVDMAASAALSRVSGSAAGAFLSAKQGLKMSAKKVVGNMFRSTLTNKTALQRIGVETTEEAASKLFGAEFFKKALASTEKKGAMDAIETFGKAAQSTFDWTAANLPFFLRSAGGTYADAYATLNETQPNMTAEEKHDRALGAGVAAGAVTIGVMTAFQKIGLGGIEDAFRRGMTQREAQKLITGLAGKSRLVDKAVWAGAVRKSVDDVIKGTGKFKGKKTLLTEGLEGTIGEGAEEAIDQAINSYITDYFTDQDSGSGRWEEVWKAGLMGAIIGAPISGYRALGNRMATRQIAKEQARELEEEFSQTLINNLNAAEAPAVAEAVRQLTRGPVRGKGFQQARATVSEFIEPTAQPEAEAAPVEAEEAPVATEGEAPVATEGEAPVATQGEAVDTPELSYTPEARLVYDVDETYNKLPSVGNRVFLDNSDAREVTEAEQTRIDELEEGFTEEQLQQYEEAYGADDLGKVRQLRVAEAIAAGDDIPAPLNPEETEQGRRDNEALALANGFKLDQQWTNSQVNAENQKGADANYTFDENNVVVGVRNSEGEWFGKPPVSEASAQLLAELEETVTPESVQEGLRQIREQEAQAKAAKTQPAIDANPIVENLNEEDAQTIQQELPLDLDNTITNISTDKLVNVSPEAAERAKDIGIDIAQTNTEQQLDLPLEGRVVEDETETAEGGQELSEEESQQRLEALRDKIVETEEEAEQYASLVNSGFPQRITTKTKAGFDVRPKSKPKGYYQNISNRAAQAIYAKWPVVPESEVKAKSESKYNGPKRVFYDPNQKDPKKRMASTKGKKVTGWLDKAGNGIFNNDPFLIHTFIENNIEVTIPKDFPRSKINPAIIYDTDTGRVKNVLSPNNIIAGAKAGKESKYSDRVINTQPSYDREFDILEVNALFDPKLNRSELSMTQVFSASGQEQIITPDQQFTVNDYVNNVTNFVYEGLSQQRGNKDTVDRLKNLINKIGKGVDDSFVEGAANSVPAQAEFFAKASAIRERILNSRAGKATLERQLDKDGNLTQMHQLLPNSEAKLASEFIKYTVLPSLPADQRQEALGMDNNKDIAAWVMTNIINNEKIVSGQPPSLGSLFDTVVSRYKKQQEYDNKAEQKKSSESLYMRDVEEDFTRQQQESFMETREGVVVSSDSEGDVESYKREVEQKHIGNAPPVTTPPQRESLYKAIEDAEFNLVSTLDDPANADLKSEFDNIFYSLFGDVPQVRQFVTESNTRDLVNILGDWVARGEKDPRVHRFLTELNEGQTESARLLSTSLKLMQISSRSVSGDPTQDNEYIQAIQNIASVSGMPMTRTQAKDFIKGIDKPMRNNFSRSRLTKAQQKIARRANELELNRLGLESGNPQSVIDALEYILENGTDSHKLVASLLLENPTLIQNVEFRVVDIDADFAGMYSKMPDGRNRVVLNMRGHNGRGLANVLLEEYVHATLSDTLAQPFNSLPTAQQKAVQRLQDLMQEVREAASEAGYASNSPLMDSLENMDEFVSGILLSPDLQQEIKALGMEASGQKTLFRRIAEAIMRFFRKGVSAKESSKYADAIADVIDLSLSTIRTSDPRLRTRVKRMAEEVVNNMELNNARAERVGMKYIRMAEELPTDATPEEIAEAESRQEMEAMFDELTDEDVVTDETLPREQREAYAKAQSLLQVARQLVPPEVPLALDRTITSVAEFKNGVVLINPEFLMNLTDGLGLFASKAITAKVVSHELSHVASYNTLMQEEIDQMIESMPQDMYEDIARQYYESRPEEAEAAVALLRAEELDAEGQAELLELKEILVEEHLRMRMERLTSGYTTEEDWIFYRTNPNLFKTLFRYASSYFRRFVEMRRFNRDLNGGADNRFMDSATNNLIHELRRIKAGYRIQDTSVAFDPANPNNTWGILNDIDEEGLNDDPERFLARVDGLQASIALPPDYVAQESNEHDEFRVGTAKLGTKKKPQTTPNSSNISGTLVDDKLLAKQMGKAKYAHLPLSIKRLRNPQKKREALVNWFADNLIYLHNAFPADLRARATHWYDGARILSERFADKFDTTPEQVAGVMAALSPQKDWFMNVAQAEQLIDIWTNHQNTRLTDELVGKEMQSILDGAAAPAKQKKKKKDGETPAQAAARRAYNQKLDDEAKAERAQIFEQIKGKTIAELQDNRTAEGWGLRILAQTLFGRNYNAISPEGEVGHVVYKEDGSAPAKNGWGSVDEITKGINILKGEPISDNLGEMHKVRNFFNNIVAPNSPQGDVTIDTHAVAAAHLLPFGSSAVEVKHNFGTDMNGAPASGINGVYHLYADAYRLAASKLGLQPRQLQSITWEAIRLVHSAESRRDKKYIAEQKQLWKNENHVEARDNITRGTRFTPAWAGFGSSAGTQEFPAGLQEDGRGDVADADRRVRARGLAASISRGNIHGRTTASGGTVLFRAAGEEQVSTTQADGRLLELNPEKFSEIGNANKASHKFGSSVDVNAPAEYAGYDLIVIERNGETATASVSPSGEVGSVTKSPNAPSSLVDEAFAMAVAGGNVKWLYGFDTVLPSIYSGLGFEVVGRLPFDPEQKPDNWDYETYSKFNGGQPDVVFMRYTGNPTQYEAGSGQVFEGFDQAIETTLAKANVNKTAQREAQNPSSMPPETRTDAQRDAEDGPFIIWDTIDKVQVGSTYKQKNRARSRVDKLDGEYGGYRYQVRSTKKRGLQASIAPSRAFSPDKLDYSGFVELLEIPMYATGGYDAPRGIIGKLFKGEGDSKMQRLIQRRDAYMRAIDSTARSFQKDINKELKKTFGTEMSDTDIELLNKAIGRSAIVPSNVMDQIENDYENLLNKIAETEYETVKERKEAEAEAKALKSKAILQVKKIKADEIKAEQADALNTLQEISPELVSLLTGLRNKLIIPIQEKIKDLYGLDENMRAHFDLQKGIYITTTYRMFTDSGYMDKARKNPEYPALMEEAAKYYENAFIEDRLSIMQELAEETNQIFDKTTARRRIEQDLAIPDPSDNKTYGQRMVDEFLAQYEKPAKGDVISTLADDKPLEDNLKQKKDIPVELRRLLGEEDTSGTADALIRTLVIVGNMAAQQSMLQSMRSLGLRQGSLMTADDLAKAKEEDPETYKDWRPITGKNTTYNPFSDLMAAPDVVEDFVTMFKSTPSTEGISQAEKSVSALGVTMKKLSGVAMATKTLGNGGFYIRNLLSNIFFFGPAQGFYNLPAMVKQQKYLFDELTNPNRRDAYLSELAALNVIGEDVNVNLLGELLTGERSMEDALSEVSNKLGALARFGVAASDKIKVAKAYEVAKRMSAAVDGAYKIAYYENELKTLTKARDAAIKKGDPSDKMMNVSDRDLKRMAADVVLATAQSASQAPPVISGLSKNAFGALFAPFVRFKAEVPRIIVNTFKQTGSELRSGNAVLRRRGLKRLSGIGYATGMSAGGAGIVIQTAVNLYASMFGEGGDEEEREMDQDMKDFERGTAPKYLRDHSFSTFWYNGAWRSVNLTYINPFAMMADPFLRSGEQAIKGNIGEAAFEIVNGLFTHQYLDEQIFASAALDVLRNTDQDTGKPITEDIGDDAGHAVESKIAYLLKKGFAPDVVVRGMKWWDSARSDDPYTDEEYSVSNLLLGSVKPLKVHTIDPERQLTSYLYALRREASNIRQRKSELRTRKPTTTEGIYDLINDINESNKRINNDLVRTMRGAIKFGLTPEQTLSIAQSIFPKRRVVMAAHGVMDRVSMPPDFAQIWAAKADTPERQAIFNERFRTAVKAISEQAIIQPLEEGGIIGDGWKGRMNK